MILIRNRIYTICLRLQEIKLQEVVALIYIYFDPAKATTDDGRIDISIVR